METKDLSVCSLKSDNVHMYVLTESYDAAISAGRELIGAKFSCEELASYMHIEKADDYGIIWCVRVDDLLIDLQSQHGDCEKIDMSNGYFVLSELYKEQ